ncbi:MAG TPA: ATP-binding protein, partial [Chthoniobacteraceae bacterium]|nr:ATP-binding protein [Chthoniobacteraceae bacterium]
RGVFWEGKLIYNYLYDEKGNKRFIPVLLPGAKQEDIPGPIKNDTRYHVSSFELADPGYLQLYRELTAQPAIIKPALGGLVPLPPDANTPVATAAPLPARPVLTRFIPADISRIIKNAPIDLIGREAETKLLSDAWDQAVRGEPQRLHVLTFVALGGEGKTSLVAKWAAELAHRDWPGCDSVFAWSFYSQGTREQTAVSSDLFLAEALAFFGDAAMAGSAQGAFKKGRRLAQLVGERRALLILDGLEPLQFAPTSPTPGELKDQGLAALLKGLATSNQGLCVVTTRYSISDLRAFLRRGVLEETLTRLSNEAGVALLRSLGVRGNPSEYANLVEDVKGHALTLNLLGSFLRHAHGGDIRKRDLIKLQEANAEEQGGHAFHVIDAYVRWMAPSGILAWLRCLFSKPAREQRQEGQRALALLRLLGLFDRPATADCLEAMWKSPAITGLTGPLANVSEAQRNRSLQRLEDARLLTVNRDGSRRLVSLDAHPLLREYFGLHLRERQPECWRAAHRRLYEHLCATTKEGDLPSLEDLQPLYQAVVHGCQAGLQQEVCDGVFFTRIQRGNEIYSVRKLGAFGSNLGAIACFFEPAWSRVSPALTEGDQAWLLNAAAFTLRALGRLTEALDLTRIALEMRVRQANWKQAAISANNLSELELTLGEVNGAAADAEQSVTYADRSGDEAMRMVMRTTHADALYQAGRQAEAAARFREAEQMQAEREPAYPMLYSVQGFQYCDLLLTEAERAAWQHWGAGFQLVGPSGIAPDGGGPAGKIPADPTAETAAFRSCCAVSERAAQTLDWWTNHFTNASLLDIALNHLTLGRAALYAAVLSSHSARVVVVAGDEAQASGAVPLGSTPINNLESAVSGLRHAGAQHFIPAALLTHAWQRTVTGARTGPESAQSGLDEAWEIAERGPMPLFLADIHLHRARLFFRETAYPWNQHPDGTPRGPVDDLKEARRLIEKHGYWRRKEEFNDARAIILPLFSGASLESLD